MPYTRKQCAYFYANKGKAPKDFKKYCKSGKYKKVTEALYERKTKA